MTKVPRAALQMLLCMVLSPVFAASIDVPVDADLQSWIARAAAGDELRLGAGVYRGALVIDKPITLNGQHQAVLDAQGKGNAIVISAPDVTLTALSVQNWGHDLTETDAGIKLVEGRGLTVSECTLQGDGFGIYLQNAEQVRIVSNRITGNAALRSPDRGNGIHLTNVQASEVTDNAVAFTRDGIYIINSQNNHILRNRVQDLRFGVHYMYSYDNEVSFNTARDVDVGLALMSSNRLEIHQNRVERAEDYGLLLNFVNQSVFSGNDIRSVRSSRQPAVSGDEGKALFVYNSTANRFSRNRFADSDLGIHLTAGSEDNQLSGNQFINNEIQVKYVSSRAQEWSVDGVGNYWSNYLGWDLDSDGIGDSAFEPNDDVDKLLWKYPEAKVLMDSPAVLLLRWVQRSFPVLKAPGVKDSHPLYRIEESLNVR